MDLRGTSNIARSVSFYDYIVICLVSVIFLYLLMDKDKKMSKRDDNTTVARKAISANWQSFIQQQVKVDKRTDKYVKKPELQSPGYWKAKRLEKKALGEANTSNKAPQKSNSCPLLTKCIAIDCEMVGIGEQGKDNMLARVSLVNKFGVCIYDKFVQPREKVVDYRTPVSGVRREDLLGGEAFSVVQREVAELLRERVLVGHALKNDLEVLFLGHPRRKIRDTSRYAPFRKLFKGNTPSLKKLTQELLGVNIQGGEHSSVEDARAAMQLYATHYREWEATLKERKRSDRKNGHPHNPRLPQPTSALN